VEEHSPGATTPYQARVFFFGTALAALEKQLEKILAADRRMQSHLPPVLIQGETGTGKTAIARWLHHHGPRAARPLVEMNCSAVPDTLAEIRAVRPRARGLYRRAHGAIGCLKQPTTERSFSMKLPSLSPGCRQSS